MNKMKKKFYFFDGVFMFFIYGLYFYRYIKAFIFNLKTKKLYRLISSTEYLKEKTDCHHIFFLHKDENLCLSLIT